MVYDELKVIFAILVIIAVILVMAIIYGDPRCARGSEERAEREFLMWHEECAEMREAAMERYEEKVKGGER